MVRISSLSCGVRAGHFAYNRTGTSVVIRNAHSSALLMRFMDKKHNKELRRSQRLVSKNKYPIRFYACDYSRGVKHYPESSQFCLEIDDKHQAYLQYEREANRITLLHTEVPRELEGRGLGKLLAKEALDYVVRCDLQLIIECEFVVNFVRKHEPKYLKYMEKQA